MPTMLRVVITGPEATGKTTLARRLAEHFATAWSPEYVRVFLEGLPVRDPPSLVTWEDVPLIARGQIEAERDAERRARRILFCDTDLHSTKVYSEHYFGRCPGWIARAARARRYDLHLLLAVDVPWTADPLRDRPHRREEMWALFRRELKAAGRRVVPIGGSWSERFHRSRAEVERLLEASAAAAEASSGLSPS